MTDSNGRPCRCGPGVVHEPVDPQWLDKQIAKSADALAKHVDREAFKAVMAEYGRIQGPGVPMYDPSLGRIVYVPVDWPERKRG